MATDGVSFIRLVACCKVPAHLLRSSRRRRRRKHVVVDSRSSPQDSFYYPNGRHVAASLGDINNRPNSPGAGVPPGRLRCPSPVGRSTGPASTVRPSTVVFSTGGGDGDGGQRRQRIVIALLSKVQSCAENWPSLESSSVGECMTISGDCVHGASLVRSEWLGIIDRLMKAYA